MGTIHRVTLFSREANSICYNRRQQRIMKSFLIFLTDSLFKKLTVDGLKLTKQDSYPPVFIAIHIVISKIIRIAGCVLTFLQQKNRIYAFHHTTNAGSRCAASVRINGCRSVSWQKIHASHDILRRLNVSPC